MLGSTKSLNAHAEIQFKKRGSAMSQRRPHGFTLVELLVVIGIIAVLISILLPALSSARRAAMAVKCEATLREIGHCTLMYVQDNKQWSPPAKVLTAYNGLAAGQTYWFNFLAKYATKKKVGYDANSSTNKAQAAADARSSIFWCPAWDGYAYTSSTNPGDLAATQTGYGWNAFPEYTPSFPPSGQNLNDNPAYANNISVVSVGTNGKITAGKWYKIGQFTHPSERVLASDALFWLLQTEKPLDAQGTLYGVRILSNGVGVTTTGATTADWYRHGKYGNRTGNWFDAKSGKVAYNILYADGHVRTTNDRADIWRAQRMRYPEP
jgi:prepilin-type N-terminal cleavage/methylation domain-containing protein/prepilin-type processing-associated H-X9-DG protein